jgi:nucleoside-diphosphate-sugar epimerase
VKALVTGGTGFVGSHLVEALARRGDRVTLLVRSPERAAHLASLPGLRSVPGDLHDQEALARASAGQEVIYHVAGLVAARDEAHFLRINRDGVDHIVRAARRAGGPRLVLVSSLAAGGPTVAGRPLTGDEPPRPVTAYGRSKLAGEEIVRASGLPWTILRPPLVYGPRDTEVLRVFKLARLGLVPLLGPGDQELSVVYGPDLAGALVAAARAESAVGRTYYPCHPATVSTRDLVRAAGRVVGRRVRTFPLGMTLSRVLLFVTGSTAALLGRTTVLSRDKAGEFLQPAWTCDPARLTEETGWRAVHDLEAGLAETVTWYRSEGWI